MSPSATAIAQAFLKKHGIALIQSPEDPRSAPRLASGEYFTHDWLRLFVWREFNEVPQQAAISNAYALLRALVREDA